MKQHGVKVQKYWADNGCFEDNSFQAHCEEKNQELTFGAVGAHHQNRIVKRKIQTITTIDHTLLLHAISL